MSVFRFVFFCGFLLCFFEVQAVTVTAWEVKADIPGFYLFEIGKASNGAPVAYRASVGSPGARSGFSGTWTGSIDVFKVPAWTVVHSVSGWPQATSVSGSFVPGQEYAFHFLWWTGQPPVYVGKGSEIRVVGGTPPDPTYPGQFNTTVKNDSATTKSYALFQRGVDGVVHRVEESDFTVPGLSQRDINVATIDGGNYTTFVGLVSGDTAAPTVTRVPGFAFTPTGATPAQPFDIVQNPATIPKSDPGGNLVVTPTTPIPYDYTPNPNKDVSQVTYESVASLKPYLQRLVDQGDIVREEDDEFYEAMVKKAPEGSEAPGMLDLSKGERKIAADTNSVRSLTRLLPTAPTIITPGTAAAYELRISMPGVPGTVDIGYNFTKWSAEIGLFRAFMGSCLVVGYFFVVVKTVRRAFAN